MQIRDVTNLKPDCEIDITSESCPMTFVRTKLAIEKMNKGEVLAVLLKGEEPRRNVPRAVRDHGHAVIDETEIEGGFVRLLIEISGQ
ncbi:MAG: sulfurtransferase TusA family protein [Geminicoccaceae bacterium]